jgi:hypothetical protein
MVGMGSGGEHTEQALCVLRVMCVSGQACGLQWRGRSFPPWLDGISVL